MLAALTRIDCWIFDLDNTLYPASCDLFALIDARMTAYVARLLGLDADEAYRIQKAYFHKHGTTLAGLMAEHGVDPQDFLADVHAIEMDVLREDRRLIEAIGRLPGRKLVFTNGDGDYAARVLERIGLTGAFEAVHDIHACAYKPKPDPESYAAMVARFGIRAETALFVEDMARNLKPAKALGMTTVWVDNGSDQAAGADDLSFIDYRTDDLGQWLQHITGDQHA